MSVLLCPSLMCIDFSQPGPELAALQTAGADMFHIDVMDGNFVPNFALGTEDIKAVARLTTLPFDVHLMIANPEPYIGRFAALGCRIIYVHAEATLHLHRTLQTIRQHGALAGVALNPGTPLTFVEEVLDAVDAVLVMSVDPGFAGQKFIPATIPKVRRLRALLNHRQSAARIALDGAVSGDVVRQLGAEVDAFILGTAGLFGQSGGYGPAMDNLRHQARLAREAGNLS